VAWWLEMHASVLLQQYQRNTYKKNSKTVSQKPPL
jgi:hypothetical protein